MKNIEKEPDICPCCGQEIQLESSRKRRKKATVDSFEAFWSAYPKKVGKGAARTSWTKNNLPELDILLTALRKAIASPDWQKEMGKFIPHASTWLNQQRWEDDGMDYSALKIEKPTITSKLGINEQEAFEWRSVAYPESVQIHPRWNTLPFSSWPKSTQQEYLDSITK